MMSWLGCLIKIQSFLSYVQKIAKTFSKFLGGWVVQKSLKTPLHNIKMTPNQVMRVGSNTFGNPLSKGLTKLAILTNYECPQMLFLPSFSLFQAARIGPSKCIPIFFSMKLFFHNFNFKTPLILKLCPIFDKNANGWWGWITGVDG